MLGFGILGVLVCQFTQNFHGIGMAKLCGFLQVHVGRSDVPLDGVGPPSLGQNLYCAFKKTVGFGVDPK